jgi:hypothetical protein
VLFVQQLNWRFSPKLCTQPVGGIHAVRKRLADGTVRMHYYLGRHKGAPVLKGEPGTPEFLDDIALREALEGPLAR